MKSAESSQHLYPTSSSAMSEEDISHFRRVAFLAVALSTVTVLACVVGLPLCYQYVQRVQSGMMSDMDFCKVNFAFLPFQLRYRLCGGAEK